MNGTGGCLKIIQFLMKLLFPGCCPICGEVQEQLLVELFSDDGAARICPECEKKLVRVSPPFCMRCGKPLTEGVVRSEYCGDCTKKSHTFVQGRAVFVYQGAVIGSMHRLKYGNRRDFAATFAREAYEMHGDWIRRIAPQALVPIPLHAKRRRERGYNQAELLAEALSKLAGIPVEKKMLLRRVNTRPQKQLTAGERKNNLKNAFQMSKKSVQLEKVLLIDDIYTTGSTVDAAARALMAAGIKKVYVLCICIGGGDGGGLDNGSKSMQNLQKIV